MHLLFALFLIPFGALHFLPTIIAALRRGRSLVGIFLLNLFLGWTVIGWIIALIWALTNEREYSYAYAPPTYTPPTYGPPAYVPPPQGYRQPWQ